MNVKTCNKHALSDCLSSILSKVSSIQLTEVTIKHQPRSRSFLDRLFDWTPGEVADNTGCSSALDQPWVFNSSAPPFSEFSMAYLRSSLRLLLIISLGTAWFPDSICPIQLPEVVDNSYHWSLVLQVVNQFRHLDSSNFLQPILDWLDWSYLYWVLLGFLTVAKHGTSLMRGDFGSPWQGNLASTSILSRLWTWRHAKVYIYNELMKL